MAKFTTDLSITTPKETTSATLSGDYTEVFSLSQQLDNSDSMITVLSNSSSVGSLTLNDCKTLMIKNSGAVGAELNILLNGWAHGSPDADDSHSYISMLLASGEFIMLPNLRILDFSAQLSAAKGLSLTNQVPDANMYTDSTADSDDDSGADITGSASSTNLFVEGSLTEFFYVGDLIRVNNEIMEVTEVAAAYLTVIRGVHGSTAVDTHADDAAIRFPFFNAYADFDKYSTVQTDGSGRFKCNNFFGYGRTATEEAAGIVPGSASGKFYSAGYQELGMSGITSSTESGLTASTEYGFDITVDGSGLVDSDVLKFTTGTSTKFGGSSGILRKIQDVFDSLYYTAGNLLNEKVTVGIVNGDIRFTSGQRLSTSAILLAAPSAGETTPFGVGRLPAIGVVEAAVPARLPDDTIIDKRTGSSSPNLGAFFYDDGRGNISGACNGTINYKTGAIDLNGCPGNSNFVVSANYGSAHSGGNKFSSGNANSLQQIRARSVNAKINTSIELIGIR
tara:strand:+ start:17 stop:1537 length:1521 start_codon:yes stop_codon:yes gene_type:complete